MTSSAVLRDRVGSLRGSIASGASAALSVNVFGAAVKFLSQVVFARLLGVGDYGQYVYALGWIQLLAPAATLGYGSGVLAFAPGYRATKDWDALAGVTSEARRVSFWFGGLIAVGGASVARMVDAEVALQLAFAAVPLMAVTLVQQELLRSSGRVVLSYTITLLIQPLLAIAGVAVMRIAFGDLSAVEVIGAMLVSLLVVLAMQALLLRAQTPGPARRPRPRTSDRRWRKTSLWLMASTAAARVMQQADIVLVGLFLGPVEAGLYGAASRLSELGTLVHSSVASIVAPAISSSHALGDRPALQRTVASGVRLSLWPSLVVLAGLVLQGERVLGVFGPEFTEARWALTLLALASLISAATGPCGHLLGLTGHERPLARLSWIHAILAVASASALIPIAGINGAAAARMITVSSWNVLAARMALRRTGVRSYPTLRPRPTAEASP